MMIEFANVMKEYRSAMAMDDMSFGISGGGLVDVIRNEEGVDDD